MGVPKRMAVVVSGLVFAGGAALAIGAASPANAQVPVAAPQVSTGCGGCHSSHRFRDWRSNHFRHHQRVIVINRNNNFGRSGQAQRQRQEERLVPGAPNNERRGRERGERGEQQGPGAPGMGEAAAGAGSGSGGGGAS